MDLEIEEFIEEIKTDFEVIEHFESLQDSLREMAEEKFISLKKRKQAVRLAAKYLFDTYRGVW